MEDKYPLPKWSTPARALTERAILRNEGPHVLGTMILVVVIFATLSPNELRPRTGVSADVERFLAFAALSGTFVFA